MPVVLLMLAGAMLFGGAGLYDQARQEQARAEALRRQTFEADILAGALRLEDLRDEARRRGLDPDLVQAGYEALQRRVVSLDDVVRLLRPAA